jgi:hypothetical protein
VKLTSVNTSKDRVNVTSDVTSRDMARGKRARFTCHKTTKKYTIDSFKGDGCDLPVIDFRETFDHQMGDMCYDLDSMVKAGASFKKKKHYFFYSKSGGYGKSTFMHNFCRALNGDIIRDLKNMTGVSEKAQFLFVDEYGPKRRFDMDDLKGLTCGTACGFTGNRKSYGPSFKPRSDVQLIILSNKHLFDCMGTYDRKSTIRKVSPEDAELLKQRFTIHRMDETPGATEEIDSAMHTDHHREVYSGHFIIHRVGPSVTD